MSNSVFIATSLDGFIASSNNELDWLPNSSSDNFGFNEFMGKIDAVVMGKNTFEVVCGFDCEWAYNKPVFVLSNSTTQIPKAYQDKATLIKGNPKDITHKLNIKGYNNLYIDGGATIQNFLKENLIDELTITTIPILLGGGIPLFGELKNRMPLKHIKTKEMGGLVQSSYKRDKNQ